MGVGRLRRPKAPSHPVIRKNKKMKAKRIITWATIIAMLWVVGQIQDQFCR